MAPVKPTGLLADRPGPWSILDAARPVSEIPEVGAAESEWAAGGLNLWWRTGQVDRLPMRTAHAAPFDDPDGADLITDPTVWPTAVSIDGGVTFDAPQGLKNNRVENQTTRFRPFWIQAPLGWWDTSQGIDGDVGDEVRAEFEAHKAWAVGAEFVDSLYSKNPGLQLTGVDQSAASPVHPIVAVATLYEAFANDSAEPSPNGSGDAMLTVPYHSLSFLMAFSLVRWTDDGRLLDCYGNPVNVTPGVIPSSPVSDPTDLETATAPTAGNGWFYISPRPYVAIGDFVEAVRGQERVGRNARPGTHAESNQEVQLAEAPAIVVVRPTRIYAVETSLNSSLP